MVWPVIGLYCTLFRVLSESLWQNGVHSEGWRQFEGKAEGYEHQQFIAEGCWPIKCPIRRNHAVRRGSRRLKGAAEQMVDGCGGGLDQIRKSTPADCH